MKGLDGLAEHTSAVLQTAIAATDVIAAPAAGLKIVVFALSATINAAGIFELGDATQGVLWEAVLAANTPVSTSDPYGLFECTDGEALNLLTLSAGTIRVNVTFELRPSNL